jgi:hypothetical protein
MNIMNFKKNRLLSVIILITIIGTLTQFYFSTYENSDVVWIIKSSINTNTPQTPEDLSDEQNTIGDDLQYTYLSNQTIVSTNKTNVILISIDGFSRYRFNQYKENLTTINKLLAHGWVQLNVTNYANYTQTKNGHATMLSGFLGSIIEIYGNNYNYRKLPVGYTFLEKAEKKYGSNQIATGFITGKYKNIYPVFNTSALTKLDYVYIQEQVPKKTGKLCLAFLEEYGMTHFTAFFHFRDPDKTGHLEGEGRKEWREKLKVVDNQIGNIINKLNETQVLNRTIIYITTDHGFKINGKTHLHEPDIWLLSNDKNTVININNSFIGLQDIAPTICYTLDLYFNYSNILNGQPLQLEFPQEKIDFREKYLADNVPPTVEILENVNMLLHQKIVIQVSEDVNQLYLVYKRNKHVKNMIARKSIPLGTSTITIKIDRTYLNQYDKLFLGSYDISENYTSTPIKES